MIYTDLAVRGKRVVKNIETIFDYNNEDSMKKFKEATSDKTAFTDCFADEKPLLLQAKRWEKMKGKFLMHKDAHVDF